MLVTMDEGNAPPVAGQDLSRMTFEEALVALEGIVQQLERGDVPLDQSISLYERGEALRLACQQRLDAAQARIEKIVTGADGHPTSTQAFDAGS
jgi:exodeoxyribonuclease VII small subunit